MGSRGCLSIVGVHWMRTLGMGIASMRDLYVPVEEWVPNPSDVLFSENVRGWHRHLLVRISFR